MTTQPKRAAASAKTRQRSTTTRSPGLVTGRSGGRGLTMASKEVANKLRSMEHAVLLDVINISMSDAPELALAAEAEISRRLEKVRNAFSEASTSRYDNSCGMKIATLKGGRHAR